MGGVLEQPRDSSPGSPSGPLGASAMPDELHPRHLWRRLALLAVVVAVVAAAVAAVPGLVGIRHRLGHAEAGWLAIAAAAQLAAALSYVALLRGVFCRQLRWGLSLQIGFSELAADALLPGGGTARLALGPWALHRGGMSTGHVARRSVVFFLASSAANFAVVILAGLGLALGVLPGRASLVLALTPAAVSAAVVLLLVLVLPRLLDRIHPGGGVGANCTRPTGPRARIRRRDVREPRRRRQGDRLAAALGPTSGAPRLTWLPGLRHRGAGRVLPRAWRCAAAGDPCWSPTCSASSGACSRCPAASTPG